MVVSSCIRLCVDVCGWMWVYVVVSGCIWLYMVMFDGVCGFAWLDVLVCAWVRLCLLGRGHE